MSEWVIAELGLSNGRLSSCGLACAQLGKRRLVVRVKGGAVHFLPFSNSSSLQTCSNTSNSLAQLPNHLSHLIDADTESGAAPARASAQGAKELTRG